MKSLQYPCRFGIALTALTIFGLGLMRPPTPVVAQQPSLSQDQVPFKVTATGTAEGFIIPLAPAIVQGKVTGKGEGVLQGQRVPITAISEGTGRLSLDGKPLAATDATAVFTTTGGERVSIRYEMVFRLPTSPTQLPYEGTFSVTGGTGRFEGATGSGVFRGEVNPLNGEASISADGTISRPKVRAGFGSRP